MSNNRNQRGGGVGDSIKNINNQSEINEQSNGYIKGLSMAPTTEGEGIMEWQIEKCKTESP